MCVCVCVCVWAVYYKQIRKSEQRPPLHLRTTDLVPQPRVCMRTGDAGDDASTRGPAAGATWFELKARLLGTVESAWRALLRLEAPTHRHCARHRDNL